MKQPMPLWLSTFIYNLVGLVPGLCVAFGLANFVIPPLRWLFTHQLKWMSFNEWLGYALLGVPIGIMAAGVMAVYAWTLQTDAPIMKKIVVSVLICGLLAVGSVAAGKGIRLLFLIS